jgi:hypothetical protein
LRFAVRGTVWESIAKKRALSIHQQTPQRISLIRRHLAARGAQADAVAACFIVAAVPASGSITTGGTDAIEPPAAASGKRLRC